MSRLLHPRDWPLRTKTLVLLFLVSALPVAGGAGLAAVQARHTLVRERTHLLEARADQLAAELDAFHRYYRGIVRRIASRPVVLDYFRRAPDPSDPSLEPLHDLLTSFTSGEEDISVIALLDTRGTVVYGPEKRAIGTDASFRDYVKKTLVAQAGETVVSDIFSPLPAVAQAPLIAYTAPVFDGPRRRGLLLLAVRASSLWQVVRAANGRAGTGSFALVLDHHGIRIAHSFREDFVFRPAGSLPRAEIDALVAEGRFGKRTRELLEPISVPEQFELARRPVLSGMHVGRVLARANQQWNLQIAQRLDEVAWTVFVLVPEATVYDVVDVLVRDAVLAAGLIILLALGVGVTVTRLNQAQVLLLAGAANRLAKGEQGVRVAVTSKDETGVLAESWNQMAAAVEEGRANLERRVRDRTLELERANLELTAQREELMEKGRELQAQQRELVEQNQAVQRADRMKSEFLANMSHELRTPLNSIIGFSELLAEETRDTLNARHQRFLSDVHDSGKHLLTLINDILDLSKIEAGGVELDRTALDPEDAVTEACQLVTPIALRRHLRLVQRVTTQIAVRADAGKLRQVLLNLLSNAIKFGTEGSEVAIGAEDAGMFVRFFVRNQGAAIPAALGPRLFQPFVQGEDVLVKQHQGTGLGLAICKRLVEQHGGAIGFESAAGEGTTFWFTIPNAHAHAGSSRAPAEGAAAPRREADAMAPAATDSKPQLVDASTTERQPRVLVIDDEPRAGALLRDLLSPAGYVVEIATSGAAGVAAARARPPDAAIVDLRLPDRSGIDVIEALVADEVTAAVPIMLLTAEELSAAERARLAPHVELFAKKGDLATQELLAAAARLTRRARPQRPDRHAKSVLVIDDHDLNRELVRTILERKGYVVQQASRGLDGLRAARKLRPDLILMDIAMPGMDGYTAARELKADPATAGIPIVALTALAMTGDEDKVRAAGMDGYLSKPVDRAKLESLVDATLRTDSIRP